MKSTGQRVTLVSYGEDGTLRVLVSGQYNCIVFDREVFGIAADDLEECDLPGADEMTGTLLTEEAEVDSFLGARIAEMHERGERHNEANCPICTSSKPR